MHPAAFTFAAWISSISASLANNFASAPYPCTIESAEPAETPNFSESTSGVQGGVEDAAANLKATRSRKAPVSAIGNFTRSVELQVPPGRLGMTPSLALTYDSGSSAESAVGVGWSFGTPSISRSVRKGFPAVKGPDSARTYDDSVAVFTGPNGEMVPAVDGPAGAGRLYAPAREASPVRYEYRPEQGGSFIEHDPSGKKRYFGVDPKRGRTGRITNELGTHSWLLMREEDPHGNSILYSYHSDTQEARSNKRKAQVLPVLARVEWGGNSTTGQAAPFFVQTTVAPQAGPVNLLEGNTILEHRITKIDVGVESQIKWSYTLDYTTGETGKYLLSQIRRGGDAPENTTFTYSRGAPAIGPRFVDMGPIDRTTPLYTNNSRWWESINPFERNRETVETAVQAPGFRSGTKFLDVDGNGTTDAIYHAAGIGTTGTHILWEESALQSPSSSALGAWFPPALGNPTAPSSQPDTGLPYFPLNGDWNRADFATATVQEIADLDGDGDADAVSLPIHMEGVAGRGAGIFPVAPHYEWISPGNMAIRITTNTSRKTDIQHAPDSLVDHWPDGLSIQSDIIATPSASGHGFLRFHAQPKSDVKLPLVDINADGKLDMVLLKHRQLALNYVQSGAAVAVPHGPLGSFVMSATDGVVGPLVSGSLESSVRKAVEGKNALVFVDESLLNQEEEPTEFYQTVVSPKSVDLPDLWGYGELTFFSAPMGDYPYARPSWDAERPPRPGRPIRSCKTDTPPMVAAAGRSRRRCLPPLA